MQVSLIGGIEWGRNPFTVTASYDYYYIIILITLVFSVYFIGFSLLPRDESTVPIVGTTRTALNKKIKRVEAEAYTLKVRSNVMLILGILFGIGGVVSAYILFTMTSNTIGKAFDPPTIINILRPVLLLVFIETFTFFFLKQYRVIFNEYKLFFSIYLKLLNYQQVIESFTTDTQTVLTAKLNDVFLAERYDLYESKATTAINEFDSTNVLKIVETILKIKSGD